MTNSVVFVKAQVHIYGNFEPKKKATCPKMMLYDLKVFLEFLYQNFGSQRCINHDIF